MATRSESPYQCHIFVCTNDRQGARESCADGGSAALRALLKQEVEARGWRPQVRVSASGCLGLCAQGPNVMLYPQGDWFSQVGEQQAVAILERVAEHLSVGASGRERG